jgi:conjugative transfer signal peptidase TraF
MPKPPKRPADLPLLAWSDAESARAAGRAARTIARKAKIKRQIIWTLGVSGLLLVASTIAVPPKPILIWNASPSAPIGLYYVRHDGIIEPGDMVVAWPPLPARRLAAARHYLPFTVPLVKRVAAVEHDSVCADGELITIDGGWITVRRRADAQGRPLPWWQGCTLLGEGQLFLMMEEHPSSFDGRYFGVTEARDVIGKATLLWPR